MAAMVVAGMLVVLIQNPAQTFTASSSPVSDTLREYAARHGKNLVASAELLPAEKYSYHPTPAQMTFGQLVAHIVQTNVALCSTISDAAPPMTPDELQKIAKVEEKTPLVAAMRRSFEYCTQALAKADDAHLADQASMFGKPLPMSRAAVLIALAADWADHYSTAASYLRLNGLLPPTAQPKQ